MSRHFVAGMLFAGLLIYLYATKRPHTEPTPPDRYDRGRYLQRGQGDGIELLEKTG